MHMAATLSVLMMLLPTPCGDDVGFRMLLVQQGIELRPDLILLGLGQMAVAAFVLGLQFGRRSLRLMVVEVVVTPAAGFGIALGVLHRHVPAVEGSGEVAPSRGLGPGSICILLRERELQLLEEDG